MGRHFRNLDHRDVITMKPSDVRRSIFAGDVTKKPISRLLLVQTAVIIVSLCGFLWCLWKLPQEQNAFPDGFSQCPDLSYKVQNDKSVTVQCKTCPVCSPGYEPSPTCGRTIFADTPTECTICGPKTYSEEYDSGACKKCPRCGLRKTISPCTVKKSTQCGNCPKGYYQEDYTIDSCKQCSLCCEGRWYAELECIYLRQCRRKDCVQQQKKKTSDIGRLGRSRTMFPSFTKAADEIKQQVITHSASENVGFGVQDVISSHENQEQRFKREANKTLQQVNGGVVPKQNDTMIRLQSKTRSVAAVDHEVATPWSSVDMLENASWQTSLPLRDTNPTAALAPSYLGDVKKLITILITLVAIVLPFLVFIACVFAFTCWKNIQSTHLQRVSGCPDSCFAKYVANDAEYLPMLYQSKIQTDNELQDVSYSSGDVPGSTNMEARLDVACLPGILLSEMALDLKEKIARKLNVCHQGECLCGWEKLGNYFHIEEDILHDLDNEYKSKAGSPSLSLLDMLGTRGKTIPDLVNAARSLTVNCPDIAGLIEDYYFKSWKPKDLPVSQWMNE
ncbi:uncharacterized protein [Montipora capricornis]|uniref:uncharacterized protein isoform X1 n=2 Tax=Montipora capricornis TaxID=246305 RepID=UPI0035F16547